jgi:SEC-C motif-containing protein
MSDCPCGSGRSFDDCCQPHINGTVIAPTPEALMRSRYSAFTVADVDYLENTLAPDQREDFSRADTLKWAKTSQWLGLDVHHATGGGEGEAEGFVEFTARFRLDGRNEAHREIARFRKDGERWYYVDGQVPKPEQRRVAVKAGRNDPCPCGSGKKYKKCCGA